MPIATRTFRVFVSSTFEDLKEERDALQRDVFPKLRTLCEQHGARFQAIDLRWGVRDQAGIDQQTMDICLREIQRCQHTRVKPNFIVLLGQRYGWRPLPSRIEAREFETVRNRIADPEDQVLIKSWYRRDDNALPAEYLLKPRVGEWVQPESWEALEAQLRRILLDAVRTAGLSEQALVKYESSATHQEILTGLGATPEDRRHVFVFCRKVPDESCEPDLVAVKRVLRTRLPADNILSYEPGNFRELCDRVQQTVSAVIESEAAGFESRTALALEIEAHDAFARDRALIFGREAVLDAIGEYVRAGGDRPLVLYGASGTGKSAVMAQASERAGSILASAVVVRRFIGASPDSSSGVTLLRSLCEQIGEEYGIAGELPVDFNGVARVFQERLAQATSDRPLVVVLDALDQLGKDDPGRSLAWLGGALPPHCRIVISTTNDVPVLDGYRVLELGGLPQADAVTALDHWFEHVHRGLQPAQRERLFAAYSRCGLPLYLKLAFEEARGWASYQTAEECPLGEGVEGVVDTLFDRLSLEANHGAPLVRRSLGYLAAARYGLTEDEILDVLSADEEVWRDFEHRAHHAPPNRRLPVIVWSRLFLDLEPYLMERAVPRATVATFYHRQLAERIAARFLNGPQLKALHGSLAGYFGRQSNWLGEEWRQPNARRAVEFAYQQRSAGLVRDASSTLTDLGFLAAKCGAGLFLDLQEDYRQMFAILPEAQTALREEAVRQAEAARWTKETIDYARTAGQRVKLPKVIQRVIPRWAKKILFRTRANSPKVIDSVEPWSNDRIAAEIERIKMRPTPLDEMRAFESFVRSESHVLLLHGARPGFFVQQAYNSSDAGPVVDRAAEYPCERPLLLLRRRSEFNPLPAAIRTLEGHKGTVDSTSMTADGRRAVSGSDDKTVRVWDLETGVCLRTLDGHTGWIRSVSVTPDGQRAVSGGDDNTLRVWDLDSGACLRTLKGHEGIIHSVVVRADGCRAVSGGHDNMLRVWDLENGACLSTLGDHKSSMYCMSATADGRRAVSGSSDCSLRVWDLETGKCQRILQGHSDAVSSVSVTSDGRRAVSGSHDNTLRVWDLGTGACLRTLEGHTGWVQSVSVTADGRRAASGSDDHTLRVWDLEAGSCLRTLKGPTGLVRGVSMAPDGRRAMSAYRDFYLERIRYFAIWVWDLEKGVSLGTSKEPMGNVGAAISVTADGRRAVSAVGERTLRMWDVETGACVRTLEGHSGIVHSVCVSADGRRAVSGSDDNTLRVWDLDNGSCLRTLGDPRIRCMSATADGRRAVSGNSDCALRVWNLETGACLHTLEGHTNRVSAVSVTDDGRRAVSGGSDNTLRVWDLETGACVRTLEAHAGAFVSSISVTADGRRAVVGSWKKLQVWDLETGTCLRTMEGHTEYVFLSVTPDGRRAVSTSHDPALRVWDLETGACLALAHGNAGWARATALPAPRIIVVTRTGEVIVLNLREPKA